MEPQLKVSGRTVTLSFEICDSDPMLSLYDGCNYWQLNDEVREIVRRIAEASPYLGLDAGLVILTVSHMDRRTLHQFMRCGTQALRIAIMYRPEVTFRLPGTMPVLARAGMAETTAWIGGLGYQMGFVYREAVGREAWARALSCYPGDDYASWIRPPRERVLECRRFSVDAARCIMDEAAAVLDVDLCRWVYQRRVESHGVWSSRCVGWSDWRLLVDPRLLDSVPGRIRVANLTLLMFPAVREWFRLHPREIERLGEPEQEAFLQSTPEWTGFTNPPVSEYEPGGVES
jgi:hypothetical protein